MKKLFLIIFTGVFFLSCTKEITEIQQDEKEYNWKTHPNFLYENAVQMNSFSTTDYLFFNGIYKFSAFGTNAVGADFLDTITGVTMNNYFHIDQDQPTQYKFPISKNFFIDYIRADGFFSKENKLCFVSTMIPNSNSSFSFSIKDIDPSFTNFAFSYFLHNECIAINDNYQALIPYRGRSKDIGALKLALVDIKANSDFNESIDTIKTKIIELDDEYQINALYIQHLENNFFLTTDSKTYRINSSGEITGVYNYHFYDIIEKQDTAFTVGYNFDLRQYEWSYSLDKGVSWNKVAKITDQYEWLNYTIVNNQIIGFWRSQIWQFKTTLNGFESIELDNDGLEGKQITSLTVYKDKVFVSTLSGVFYKTIDDFFKVKENI